MPMGRMPVGRVLAGQVLAIAGAVLLRADPLPVRLGRTECTTGGEPLPLYLGTGRAASRPRPISDLTLERWTRLGGGTRFPACESGKEFPTGLHALESACHFRRLAKRQFTGWKARATSDCSC
jgi:hypothetical protein